MSVDVAIIGGGISGLATAYGLKRRGYSIAVLERQTTTGGNAVSEHFGGFLMEHGPSTMNADSTAATGLSQGLGIDHERCDLGDGVQQRYLVARGRLQGISIGPLGFLLSGYLSPRARLRLLAEIAVSPRGDHGDNYDDETVMAFCTRRFGREVAERIIDPLVAGIYGGRATELSVSAVFPKLVELEKSFGSVSLGLFRRRRQGRKMPGKRLFSWKNGIATLPGTLARHLNGEVTTGATVRRIIPCGGGFKVDMGAAGMLDAQAVVVATQPHVASRLLECADEKAAAAAGAIHAPPMAVVFLGYERGAVSHPLDGLGFLTPESENRNLLGAQFCSTMFDARAPEGHVAVAGYFGGVRSPDLARLSATDLVALVREEFRDLLGAKGEPVVARVRHWPVGLPQYRSGHQGLVSELQCLNRRQPGLYVTGNYFSGPSVAACLSVARNTVAEVGSYLEKTSTASGRGLEEAFDEMVSANEM